MAEIPIYGTLVNATTDPKIVNTDQAWDKELGKYQAEINKERLESSDNMEQKLQDLTSKLDSEIQDRTQGDTALGKRIDKEIQDRKDADTALDQKLSQAIKEEADARAKYDDNMMVKLGEEEDAREAADTALKTSIDDLAAKHEAFVATKGKANGLAPLDESGLVPASHLPSYVDDVIEVYATYDVNPTGGLTNIKLYTDAGHQTPVTGESGKIYINVADDEPSYQFRWSGTKFVDSNTSSLIIGEIAGTAFEGSRGKALETYVNNHFLNNTGSPISKRWFMTSDTESRMVRITPSSNGENLSISLRRASLDSSGKYQDGVESNVIPAATKTAAGVMSAADRVKLDETLPNAIAAEEAARTAKDNAHDKLIDSLPDTLVYGASSKASFVSSDKSLEITLYRKQKDSDKGIYESSGNYFQTITFPAATSASSGVMSNTDKTNLDNTVQGLANEITDRTNAINSLRTELKTYVDELIADTGSDVTALETKVNNHLANKSNPHTVTKAQVGLGNASNTSDADKPVSTAQATAIADAKAAGTAAQTSINSHAGRKDNPHAVTRAQLGLATTDQVVFAKTTAPSGFWKESSDIRLKDNIRDLNHTLDQICQIPTKSFTMLGKEDEGTIAQNLEGLGFGKYVEEVPVEKSTVPNPEEFETLEINGEEYVLVKQVKYHKMSTLAIEGVKLLYDEIKDLKAEIQELKNK